MDEARPKVKLGEGEVNTWGYSLTSYRDLVAGTVGDLVRIGDGK